MISTATEAVNASVGSPVSASQPTSVASERQHDRDEDGGDPVDEPLNGALPACASSTSRAICAMAVSLPTPCRTDEQPPERVDRSARHVVAGTDLDGDGLPREHRPVDG